MDGMDRKDSDVGGRDAGQVRCVDDEEHPRLAHESSLNARRRLLRTPVRPRRGVGEKNTTPLPLPLSGALSRDC